MSNLKYNILIASYNCSFVKRIEKCISSTTNKQIIGNYSNVNQLEDIFNFTKIDLLIWNVDLHISENPEKINTSLISHDIPVILFNPNNNDDKLLNIKIKNTIGLLNPKFSDKEILFVIEQVLEHSKIHRKINENEKKYNKILNSINDSILLLLDDIIVDCNNNTSQLFLTDKKNIIGKSFLDFSADYQYYYVSSIEKFYKVISTNDSEPTNFKWICKNAENKILYTEINRTLLPLENKNYILLVIKDITERQKIEEKLIQAETRYRELFNNTPSGIAIYKPIENGNDFIFIDFNKAAEKITKHFSEEIIGKSIFSVIKNVEKIGFYQALKEVNTYGLPVSLDEYYYEDDRVQNWQSSYIYRLYTGEIVSVFNDITKQKLSSSRLEDSEKRYRSLVELSPFGIIIYLNGIIIYANPSAIKMLGAKNFSELHGKPFIDMIDKNSIKLAMQIMDDINENKKETPIVEYTFKRLDNTKLEAEVISIPFVYQGLPAVQVVFSDITERKEMEEKLIASEEKYRRLFSSAQDMIFINYLHKNKIGNTIEFNEAVIKKTGYDKEYLLSHSIFDLIDDTKKREYEKTICEKEKDFIYIYETSLLTKKGFSIPVEISSLITEINKIPVVFSIIRDISERKLLEQKLTNAIIETEEKERRRIAQDIHDGLGPLMSSIKIYVNLIQNKKLNDTEKEQLFNYTYELIDEAIKTTKDISNNLMPDLLHDYGLYSAINNFINKINKSEVINISYNCNFKNQRLEKNIEISLYRVLLELINNTLKHAKASNIIIKMTKKRNNTIEIIYKDDGIGFNPEEVVLNEKAMGIKNIIKRIKSINGDITFIKNIDKGFMVKIEVSL